MNSDPESTLQLSCSLMAMAMGPYRLNCSLR